MRETEIRARRMILVIAALLAGEGDDQQMTPPGFRRALLRAGVICDMGFVDRTLSDLSAKGFLRSYWPDPEDLMRYRITEKGQADLERTGETVAHSLRWIEDRVSASLSRHSLDASPNPVPEAPLEGIVTLCMAEEWLDAWWKSLSGEAKGDCLVAYYEGSSAEPGKAVA